MTTPQQEVLVKFQYEYTTRDGKQVSIKPEERYLLLAKNNDHWWFVRKDESTQPFFIPAQYVTLLPSENTPAQPPGDLPNPLSDTKPSPEPPLTHEDSLHNDTMHMDVSQGASVDSSIAVEEGPYAVSPPHFPTVSSHKRRTESSKAQPDLSEDILILTRTGCDPGAWTLKEERIYESVDNAKDSHRSRKEETNLVTASPPPATPTLVSTQQGSELLAEAPDGLGDKRRLIKRRVHFQQSLLSIQDEEDDDLSSVYVNLPRFRQSISSLSSVTSGESLDPHDPLRLGSKGWEIHTDDQSGKEYYYQPSTGLSTWENPLSPGMEPDQLPASPASSPSSLGCLPPGGTSDWEKVLDEKSGQHYFYNPKSGQSSWEPPEELPAQSRNGLRRAGQPPLPEEDYPTSEEPSPRADAEPLPEYSLINAQRTVIPQASLDQSAPGWTLNVDPDGAWVFTSQHTPEQWIKSVDDQGQVYYYLRDGSRSLWNLPELPASLIQSRVGNGGPAEQDRMDNRKWRNSNGSQDEKFSITHGRMASDADVYSYPETKQHVSNLEKAGILNKTRISENGKKFRKNWAQSWTVLHGGLLTFHKDPKSTTTVTLGKSSQIGVEFEVDLKGAMIGKAAKEKSSKKNVLELKSRAGTEFLIQYDTESIITDWFKVIADTIRQLEMSDNQFDGEEEASEKYSSIEREDRSADKRRMSIASEADQKKIHSKLRKFLLKRPTLQSVKEKGYIRENVFGCHLQNLCTQEKNTVPNFVRKCIWTVEKKGLGVDGIYRVSGNLAVIQKLRFKADHENLNLEEGSWDIHVITGALKLFFRELQEPLFPYSHFNSFIQGIKIGDYINRVSYITDLVRSLPEANHDTMEALFCHLRKVIEHGEENRMSVQNVAIVFGPTLLKPEVESANFTTYMIYQNQIIEFILNEFETIFHM